MSFDSYLNLEYLHELGKINLCEGTVEFTDTHIEKKDTPYGVNHKLVVSMEADEVDEGRTIEYRDLVLYDLGYNTNLMSRIQTSVLVLDFLSKTIKEKGSENITLKELLPLLENVEDYLN